MKVPKGRDLMKNYKAAGALCLLAAAMLLPGGCAATRFEPMEEAQQKQQDQQELTAQSAEVEPDSMTAEDLVFERTMESDSGVVLASYEARVPQFSEDGAKSSVFGNINEFYQQEFEAFAADCDWVFLTLQEELGPGWNNIKDERQAVTSVFGYEMLTYENRYVSFVRDYTYTDKTGSSSVHYYAEIFDLSTGWKVGFSDLFGENAASAQAAVKDGIAQWCEKNGVAFDALDSIAPEQLTGEIALDGDSLAVCIEPFALSAGDGEGRVVRLPVGDFSQWLVQPQQ